MSLRMVLVAVLLVGVLPRARAANDTATTTARAHYIEGQKRYNLGDYKPALDEFRAAYLAKADPVFLFNIAQCLRQLGDYSNAEKSYRAYLREAPQIPDDQREQVRKLMAEMEKAQADSRAKQPPTGTQAPREDTNGNVTPPSQASAVTPPQPKAIDSRPWYAQPMAIAGFVLMPTGAILAGVGGGLVGRSGSLRDEAARTMFLGDRQQLLNDATTNQNAGYALVGVGAAVAVMGAVLTGVSASRRRSSVSAAFAPSVGGGLVVLGGDL